MSKDVERRGSVPTPDPRFGYTIAGAIGYGAALVIQNLHHLNVVLDATFGH